MNVEGFGNGAVRRSNLRLPSEQTPTEPRARSTDRSTQDANRTRELQDEVAVENRRSGSNSIRDVDQARELLDRTVRDMVDDGSRALDAYRGAQNRSMNSLLS